ncbi:hypothetical protein ACTOB_003438 [Actinoplanes oblitus]|uniref:Uncharacterized protein n=1 Tax=Actinoplanes oblitus TaxID=3040509 RepID=A0ABY8WT35_9ACTN|nr:hypothetical protein [Actinoplanes oblitus]WIN01035.1 hypothetical protein ACTOB_003438 [Actinoplanes oblitus]
MLDVPASRGICCHVGGDIDFDTAITSPPAGTTTLYLTFAGGAGALFDVDAFTFTPGGTGPVVGFAGKCAWTSTVVAARPPGLFDPLTFVPVR